MRHCAFIYLGCTLFSAVIYGKKCTPDQWRYPIDAKYNTTADIREGILNVHLIPHSHDDTGWRKTVDQYYYGSQRNVGGEGVQYILDTVIDELLKNPDRRFMFVEQAFFTRWWNEQSRSMKEVVRRLVKEGRFDLTVNGGWCMHDEAAPHFTAMIDQTTLGHRFLKNEFNVVPKIGWQIDPFGHSSTQASLLSAGVGFDALYFARIDYQDYNIRMDSADMEFIWRPSYTNDKNSEIFTGVTVNGYGPPGALEFEGGAEPIRDDPLLHDNNICEKVEQIVKDSRDRAKRVKGNHIFFPMGSDFNYQNARMQFKNMDKLIHYINQDGRVNMFYSTLSKYTQAKNAEKLTYKVKTDDFFPYGSDPHAYWSGFFSSRPSLKRYGRVTNGFLQAARQLEVYSQMFKHSELIKLAHGIGVLQHHDGISGTEKQLVALDYALRIAEGMTPAEKRVASILNRYADSSMSSPIQFCWLANISICETTQQNKAFSALSYNPLAHNGRVAYIRVPVDSPSAIVKVRNKIIKSQVVPSSKTPFAKHESKYNLVFRAESKGLTVTEYGVVLKDEPEVKVENILPDGSRSLRNQHLEATFCEHGHLKSLKRFNGKNGNSDSFISLHHDFAYYNSYQGNDGEKSGAYIFRPNSSATTNVSHSNSTLIFTRGDLVQEATRRISPWVSVTYRLYDDSTHLEVEWTVGEIPINDGIGKEVISRFTSDIRSSGTWYTDSNGREYLKRQRNFRPSWNVSLAEPVAGNYYPITTGVYIKDNEAQLTILTDRAQGATSLKDGQLEIMVHRRLLYDDSKGVDEALNETETDLTTKAVHGLVARGTFYLMLERPSESAKVLRQTMDDVFNPLLTGFKVKADFPEGKLAEPYSFIKTDALQSQLSLQTLELIDESTVLLRLSHKYANGEDRVLSAPVKVRISDYFPQDFIAGVTEVSLTANQPIAELKRLKWLSADNATFVPHESDDVESFIVISPMEIRTFIVKIKSKTPSNSEDQFRDMIDEVGGIILAEE